MQPIQNQCPTCGESFSPNPSKVHYFCSKRCKNKYYYWSNRDRILEAQRAQRAELSTQPTQRVKKADLLHQKDKQIEDLVSVVQHQQRQIEQLMGTVERLSAAAAPATFRPVMPAPLTRLADPDDVKIEMTAAKADGQASLNFMRSLSAINPHLMPAAAAPAKSGIKQMLVPAIAAPVFDDDDTLLIEVQ